MSDSKEQGRLTVYEIGYHVIPTTEEDAFLYASKIKTFIEENNGRIISEEAPKQKSLSYEISKSANSKKSKFTKSFFGWVKFESENSLVTMLKKEVESLVNTLRFIIIKTVKENTIFHPRFSKIKKEERPETDFDSEIPAKVPEISEEEIDKSIEALIKS